MIFIYGLIDPVTRQIRYVGQTNDLERRYQEHVNNIEDTHKGLWIQSLREKGRIPTLVVLEGIEDETKSNYHEKWWIVLGQKQGWSLTNSANPYARETSFGDMFAMHIRDEYESFISETNPFILISKHSAYSALALVVAVLAGVICGYSEYWIGGSLFIAGLIGLSITLAGLVVGAELVEPTGRRLTPIVLATLYIVVDLHFVISQALRMVIK